MHSSKVEQSRKSIIDICSRVSDRLGVDVLRRCLYRKGGPRKIYVRQTSAAKVKEHKHQDIYHSKDLPANITVLEIEVARS